MLTFKVFSNLMRKSNLSGLPIVRGEMLNKLNEIYANIKILERNIFAGESRDTPSATCSRV